MICTKPNTPNIAIVYVNAAGIKENHANGRECLLIQQADRTYSVSMHKRGPHFAFLHIRSLFNRTLCMPTYLLRKHQKIVRRTADWKIGMDWEVPWGIFNVNTRSSSMSNIFGTLCKMIFAKYETIQSRTF